MISPQITSKRFISIASLFILMMGSVLMACQSSTKVDKPVKNTFVQCKSPRPEICTEQYLPVCANKDTGIRCVKAPCPSEEKVTYPNACSACADSKVYGYLPGGACQ